MSVTTCDRCGVSAGSSETPDGWIDDREPGGGLFCPVCFAQMREGGYGSLCQIRSDMERLRFRLARLPLHGDQARRDGRRFASAIDSALMPRSATAPMRLARRLIRRWRFSRALTG